MSKAMERDYFLKALAENEDDTPTRLVYADWLEEHGEDDEAARMRAWSDAKAHLTEFMGQIHKGYSGEGYYTYADALEIGRSVVEGRGYCFDTTSGPEPFYEDAKRQQFFRNWSIVTGIAVPEEVVENPGIRCGC